MNTVEKLERYAKLDELVKLIRVQVTWKIEKGKRILNPDTKPLWQRYFGPKGSLNAEYLEYLRLGKELRAEGVLKPGKGRVEPLLSFVRSVVGPKAHATPNYDDDILKYVQVDLAKGCLLFYPLGRIEYNGQTIGIGEVPALIERISFYK